MAAVTLTGVALMGAALTDAGLLLVVVVGAVAIIVFALFVVREALSRPVETPRELPPPHDLPPLGQEHERAGADLSDSHRANT